MILFSQTRSRRQPMELFTKLFASWLIFIYHCFDRLVLSGYLMGLQRPGQVVYWLRTVKGIQAITKEVLSERTRRYVGWVETYARNRATFRFANPTAATIPSCTSIAADTSSTTS